MTGLPGWAIGLCPLAPGPVWPLTDRICPVEPTQGASPRRHSQICERRRQGITTRLPELAVIFMGNGGIQEIRIRGRRS